VTTMTPDEINKLRLGIESEIKAGATTDDIDHWLDAYHAGRKDLIDVIRGYVEAAEIEAKSA
jgi:hypothetical protein